MFFELSSNEPWADAKEKSVISEMVISFISGWLIKVLILLPISSNTGSASTKNNNLFYFYKIHKWAISLAHFRTAGIYSFIPDNLITLLSLPAFIKASNLFQIATINNSLLLHLCNINVSFVWHSIVKPFKSKGLEF